MSPNVLDVRDASLENNIVKDLKVAKIMHAIS